MNFYGHRNSLEEIVATIEKDFKDLLKTLKKVSTLKVIRVAQFLPQFTKEVNKLLTAAISKGKLEAILKAMKKDKSPTHD